MSPTELFIKHLEDNAEGNTTIETLVTIIRIQRGALKIIQQRCEDDYRKANGSCLLQARGAIEACDRLAIEHVQNPEKPLGCKVVWSDPEQPSDA